MSKREGEIFMDWWEDHKNYHGAIPMFAAKDIFLSGMSRASLADEIAKLREQRDLALRACGIAKQAINPQNLKTLSMHEWKAGLDIAVLALTAAIESESASHEAGKEEVCRTCGRKRSKDGLYCSAPHGTGTRTEGK